MIADTKSLKHSMLPKDFSQQEDAPQQASHDEQPARLGSPKADPARPSENVDVALWSGLPAVAQRETEYSVTDGTAISDAEHLGALRKTDVNGIVARWVRLTVDEVLGGQGTQSATPNAPELSFQPESPCDVVQQVAEALRNEVVLPELDLSNELYLGKPCAEITAGGSSPAALPTIAEEPGSPINSPSPSINSDCVSPRSNSAPSPLKTSLLHRIAFPTLLRGGKSQHLASKSKSQESAPQGGPDACPEASADAEVLGRLEAVPALPAKFGATSANALHDHSMIRARVDKFTDSILHRRRGAVVHIVPDRFGEYTTDPSIREQFAFHVKCQVWDPSTDRLVPNDEFLKQLQSKRMRAQWAQDARKRKHDKMVENIIGLKGVHAFKDRCKHTLGEIADQTHEALATHAAQALR